MRHETQRALVLATGILALAAGLLFGLLPGHRDPLFRAGIGAISVVTGLLSLHRYRQMGG